MQDNFSIRHWKNTVLHEDAFKEGIGELDVYGYQTQHFDICPGAQTLFKDILRGEFTDGVPSAKEEDKVVELAKLHDTLFALEKIALKNQGDAKAVLSKVIETASDIYELGTEIGLDQNSDLRYIQGHVEKVNDAARGTDLSEEDDIELEIPGETPTVDKTVQAKASKQDKIIKDYQRLKDLMQTELDMYKSFESPKNKELAKERLKKLTPEFQAAKKAYEKLKGVKI